MITKTEAVVLRSIRYGDSRVIVDMFTREHGRLSFIVPLPKSGRGRMKRQYFQPLTLLSVSCDVRPLRQLQTLTDAALQQPLPSLLTVPDKLAVALFLSEFLYHALKGEQSNAPLFDYVRSSIEWLDGCPDRYANFHLVFLMRLSRFLGFYPNLQTHHVVSTVKGTGATSAMADNESYFDLRAATFCSDAPLHRDFLMPAEAAHIRQLMRMDFPTMHLFRLSRAQRNRILELLLLYYRLHLPDFPELQSVGVLHDLYSD